MHLCVGAVSRRVVEEAAHLDVYQIVASRRQVDIGGGYTGYDQTSLVNAVRERSDATKIVRDHGGPNQGPNRDDGVDSLRADVDAGFDAVHLDVSGIPADDQTRALVHLLKVTGATPFEIGGEHDDQSWTNELVRICLEMKRIPTYVVLDTRAFIWADRQRGPLRDPHDLVMEVDAHAIRAGGMATKAHNFDWVGERERYSHVIDAYNLAPEIAQVEIDAWLTVLDHDRAIDLLNVAYDSRRWERWFMRHQGTWFERARCAARYVLEYDEVNEIIDVGPDAEDFVRGRIRDAIVACS